MKKITVYIVEDYKLTRMAYLHYFSTIEEITVLGAFETAEECLEAMKNEQADIVLMDLGLPYMNGLEATDQITRNYPDTNVIVTTSHDRDEEVYASLALGAKAYTLKDLKMEELVEVIKNVHKGALWVDPKKADIVLQKFPKPNYTNNIENLYEDAPLHVSLTDRERKVLELLVEGKSNMEIANEIHVSHHTAKSHVCKIFTKLEVSDRVQAAVKAVKYNLY